MDASCAKPIIRYIEKALAELQANVLGNDKQAFHLE